MTNVEDIKEDEIEKFVNNYVFVHKKESEDEKLHFLNLNFVSAFRQLEIGSIFLIEKAHPNAPLNPKTPKTSCILKETKESQTIPITFDLLFYNIEDNEEIKIKVDAFYDSSFWRVWKLK